MKIAIIGAGAWGSAFGKVLLEKGHKVTFWARNQAEVARINTEKTLCLAKAFSRPFNSLTAETDFDSVIQNTECVVYALPSKLMVETFKRTVFDPGLPIVILAKGFVDEKATMPHQWLHNKGYHNVFVLSGPNLASEIFDELPASAVLAGTQQSGLESLQAQLNTDSFRLYTNPDLNGVALGGIVKNAYTIAAGLCEGLELGKNAKAALLTRMIAELQSLYVIFDADPQTMIGLSGLGDLILSSSTQNSRNFKFGFLLAHSLVEAGSFQKTHTVEGIRTVEMLSQKLSDSINDYPILQAIYRILKQEMTVETAMKYLMTRELKQEF